MGNALERRSTPSLDETYRLAKGFAMSGYFADAKSAEQALVKIMAGAEMGLSPFQSMSGIHVISGKPVVGSGLLAAMIDQHPDYDYAVAWEPNEQAPTACTVTIFKNGAERGRSSFSMQDAKRAGLIKPGSGWEKYPGAMLFARAISQGVRWYAAGVAGQSVYVEGDSELVGSEVIDPQPPAHAPVAVSGDAPSDETIYDADADVDVDEDAAPSPREDESWASPGQTAASDEEPAAPVSAAGSGLLIDSPAAAKAFIRGLDGSSRSSLLRLLGFTGPATLEVLSGALHMQRTGGRAADVLKEIA